ncbi:MAG: deoxyguanosinetriphosphate triphosphohydrolase [Clostridia bacterium]|nr:deoxyguanosinetriphosphate triphosphohydrolase [Clostridia bacterium]
MSKERTYQIEDTFLSPYAQKSKDTKGRAKQEIPCSMRTDFQRDRDRIIYSKAFRRLKNKTQVFFSPDGDHYVTRLTHTFDVSQIARSIARSLALNEDLTEAIALGHDLGHTPCGHVGERVLNSLCPTGFKHNIQSLRVVDVLEKDGRGLNLTYEVRDGILQHKSSGKPQTLEGVAVSLADRIAYINHDIEDAIRGGYICDEDLPKGPIETLGRDTRERINTAITDIVNHSQGKNFVAMSEAVSQASQELRAFMFEAVYAQANKNIQDKAERMLTQMYNYFVKNTSKLPPLYAEVAKTDGVERAVCDYISSMTDRYAIGVFEDLFIPKNFSLDGRG